MKAILFRHLFLKWEIRLRSIGRKIRHSILGQSLVFEPEMNKYTIQYDDSDIEFLDLRKEKWNPLPNSANFVTCFMANNEPKSEEELMLPKPERFNASRRKELDGLFSQGVFLPVPKSEAAGSRLFGCRFVDTMKNEGTPNALEKSRLVVQGYNDKADRLLTHATTVQRSSQLLLFALANSFPKRKIANRDVTQAYTQSATELSQDIR